MLKIVLDCLKSPYDFANMIQVVLASQACEAHITGNSLHHMHDKIRGKVASWSSNIRMQGYSDLPIYYHDTLEQCCSDLKAKGLKIIGTSSHATKSFYDLRFADDKTVIVFGTESSGLSRQKITLMDEMVKIPQSNKIDFMTLSIVVPIVVYEYVRQRS